jgi:hypothetical protein
VPQPLRDVVAPGQPQRSDRRRAEDRCFVQTAEFLLAAGLLLGILGTLRFSPLGAALIGIGYTMNYVLLLVAPKRVLSMFDRDIFFLGGHRLDPGAPVRTGTRRWCWARLLLVGVFSKGRWRRWPRPVRETEATQAVPLGADGLGIRTPHPATEPGMGALPDKARASQCMVNLVRLAARRLHRSPGGRASP